MSQKEKRLAANQNNNNRPELLKKQGMDEKRISKDCGEDALKQIEEIVDQQIEAAKHLSDDELRQIILFREKEENGNEIIFRRPHFEGETLAQKIGSGPIETQKAIELIQKIGRIVSTAHENDIVHGSLIPDNIIIAKDSSVCIIDYTKKICRKIDDAQHVSMTQEKSAGTEYMDPEQCLGGSATKQSDVYALGMILYAMLAGEPPYAGMTPEEIIKEKIYHDASIASKHPGKIDPRLSDIIDGALCREHDRIQTVSEFLYKIDNCSSEEVVSEKPQPQAKHVEIDSDDSSYNPLDKTPKYEFVLVGHSHAGKTVLAAGLCLCNSESFAVEANSQTRKNAVNLMASLSSHKWPTHTVPGEGTEYSFFISKNQENVASISFPEYAGEDINQPRYFNRLKKANAVLLLLNPNIMTEEMLGRKESGDRIDEATLERERIDRISRLKECIRNLSRLPVVPPVAFLVTAADRLNTDLKDKKDEFEKYAKEIMVSLNSNKVPAKRFDVSVTGELEIQGKEGGTFKPVSESKLNPSNIDAPFIWLLDQLEQQKKKESRDKLLKTIRIPAIACAVVLLILLGVIFRHPPKEQPGPSPATRPDPSAGPRPVTSAGTTADATDEQNQPDNRAVSASDDHIREIEAIDPSNISAVKSAVSKYRNYPKDEGALITLVKKTIDARFEDMANEWNDLTERQKNWKKASDILRKGVNGELKSLADQFEASRNYLYNGTTNYQRVIANLFDDAVKQKSDSEDITSDVTAFSLDESGNPYIDEMERWFFDEVLYMEFKKLFDYPYQAEEKYLTLNRISSEIAKSFLARGEKAKRWKTWCGEFTKWKKKNSKYTVEFIDLQAKVTYDKYDDPFFRDIFIGKKNRDNELFSYHSKGYKTTRFNNKDFKSFDDGSLPHSETLDLGECIYFYAQMVDEKGRGDTVKDTVEIRYYPGIDDPDVLRWYGSNSVIWLKLYVTSAGSSSNDILTFKQWRDQNPLPR